MYNGYVLILHIIIALSTVGISGMSLLRPTQSKINSSIIFTVATFVTGGYLVVINPSHLVSACISGLVFIGVVGVLLLGAHNKLAQEKI